MREEQLKSLLFRVDFHLRHNPQRLETEDRKLLIELFEAYKQVYTPAPSTYEWKTTHLGGAP